MVSIVSLPLPDSAARQLEAYQAKVDAASTYPERVQLAARKFKSYNTPRNTTFQKVRATLDAMCDGVRRCMYCEDSAADEVEHYRPKNLYPGEVFVWENYLYSCGGCNALKKNHFAVFDGLGNLIDLTPAAGAPVSEPATGDPVLLNPRFAVPTDFLMLDLADTFQLVPLFDEGCIEHVRAAYTINVLGLNKDLLVRARQSAFVAYRELLEGYLARRKQGEDATSLDHVRTTVLGFSHCTVWFEMKRQYPHHEALRRLFEAAPEVLGW